MGRTKCLKICLCETLLIVKIREKNGENGCVVSLRLAPYRPPPGEAGQLLWCSAFHSTTLRFLLSGAQLITTLFTHCLNNKHTLGQAGTASAWLTLMDVGISDNISWGAVV